LDANGIENEDDQRMSDDAIGIIGAGKLGQALARNARRAGRPVVFANSRGPESLAPVIAEFDGDVTAGTPHDAAQCPIVALAVPWVSVEDAVSGLSWTGQILIDATNAVLLPSLEPVPLGGATSSEIIAKSVPGARVVKAHNHNAADVLGSDPRGHGGRRALFVSGDDANAKSAVVALFDTAGFAPIDLGGLVAGGAMQQWGGPLAGHDLVRMPAPWE
jgi:8-hydroxy-5-deazaflavin:NADPH oxidoreductase